MSNNLKMNYSPWKLIVLIILSIFIIESGINFGFHFLDFNPLIDSTLDSSLLVIIIFPVLYIFALRPLTDQIIKTKYAQDALEDKIGDLEKFKLAFENVSEQIVITDSRGIVVDANVAVENITGFGVEEVIGKALGSLWGGQMDDEFYKKLWETIKVNKKTFMGEFKNKRKNGEFYTAEAMISPILGKEGDIKFFVSVERDITKAKEIDRMKTEFISLASHQLRTPLTAMKWFGELLINGDAGVLTEKQQEYMKNIYKSNERMIALVNSLLNVSRIESGRLIIEPKPTDLEKLINQQVIDLKPKTDLKKQQVIVTIKDKLPLINIDPKLIEQVYLNLLTNAIKYTSDGGEIKIIVFKKGNKIETQIIDNGYGIPKKEQERVFQKFFRADNITKIETDGTGLGLYLVKLIIDSSGGKVWFESEENKGTTFSFDLPLSGVKAKNGEVTLDS